MRLKANSGKSVATDADARSYSQEGVRIPSFSLEVHSLSSAMAQWQRLSAAELDVADSIPGHSS